MHNVPVKTRFPTKYNPVRSAFKQEILLPAGVVYNPAPSAPTALETPAAFLPAAERQQRAFTKDANPYNVATMPAVSPAPQRTYHLKPEDVKEIQQLRSSEPFKWTRKALAKKYNVSEFVIGMVSAAPAEHQQEMSSRLTEIKGMWNDKRSRARAHRARRKNFWLRNE